MIKKITLPILIALTISSSALAEPDHYKNILVGDRAATMGGTYIGISNDVTGTYYNPGGIAFADEDTGISASANVYHVQHATYKNAIRSEDWYRHSAVLLPTFFGLMKRWGDHTVAFSIITPDSFIQNQDQVYNNLPATSTQPAIDRFLFNLHSEDSSYLIGPSYAYRVSDKLAIGTTLSYFYRKSRMQDIQNIWLAGGQTEASTIVTEWGENGIAPKIGVKWVPIKDLSFGLTVFHIFIVSSNFTGQLTDKTRDQNTSTFNQINIKQKRNTSTQISLGAAYQASDTWLFAADVDFNTQPPADVFYPAGYQGVVNYSLGIEHKFNKRHVGRLGFFTNQSNMQEPSNESSLITELNLYGMAMGYSFNMEKTSITAGIVYSGGSGKAQIYEDMPTAVDVTRYTFTGILATSFKF